MSSRFILVITAAACLLGPVMGMAAGQDNGQKEFRAALGFYKAGRMDQARPEFLEVLRQDPGNAKANYYLGLIAYQAGNLQEAARFFQWGADHAPQMPGNHYYLGRVAFDLGLHEQALHEFDQALKQDSQMVMAYYYRGLANYKLKRVKEARKALEKAVALAPQMARARYALAYLFFHDAGELDKALKQARQGLKTCGDDANLRNKFEVLISSIMEKR